MVFCVYVMPMLKNMGDVAEFSTALRKYVVNMGLIVVTRIEVKSIR